jgi:hypothetical protein
MFVGAQVQRPVGCRQLVIVAATHPSKSSSARLRPNGLFPYLEKIKLFKMVYFCKALRDICSLSNVSSDFFIFRAQSRAKNESQVMKLAIIAT